MKMRPVVPSSTYYRTSDLARLLGVDESTIKRWADHGEIPCVKTLGGHRRFTQGAVRELTSKMNVRIQGTAPKGERGLTRR
jgi:excisionase family DNA binding protein